MDTKTQRALLLADRAFILEITEKARFASKQAQRAARAFTALDPETGVEASQKAAAAGTTLVQLQKLAEASGIASRHRSAFIAAAMGAEDEVWSYFAAVAHEIG